MASGMLIPHRELRFGSARDSILPSLNYSLRHCFILTSSLVAINTMKPIKLNDCECFSSDVYAWYHWFTSINVEKKISITS